MSTRFTSCNLVPRTTLSAVINSNFISRHLYSIIITLEKSMSQAIDVNHPNNNSNY